MALADLIQRVRDRGREAKQTIHELAVSIIEGADVSDDAIAQSCRDAGESLDSFAALLAKLEQRKKAFDDFHARDFDAEIATTRSEYVTTMQDAKSVQTEVEALMAERVRLTHLGESLSRNAQRLEREKKDARNALTAALGSTPQDWRLV